MKKKFLKSSIDIIKKSNPNISEEQIEIIEYGLEGIYLTFSKLIILIILSSILGILWQVILLSIFYNIIRTVAFGLHASKSIHCLIMSLVMFIGGTYICLGVNFSLIVKVIISVVCVFSLFRYAPADTVKRPIVSKKRRNIYKFLSTLFGLIYTFAIFACSDNVISMFMLIGMVEAVIMVLPISYKVLNLSYDNYKNYEVGLSN